MGEGTSWMGWPIFTPKAFASLLRAMAHPSLFDSTTTGWPRKVGSNTRSHEAWKLLRSTKPSKSEILGVDVVPSSYLFPHRVPSLLEGQRIADKERLIKMSELIELGSRQDASDSAVAEPLSDQFGDLD